MAITTQSDSLQSVDADIPSNYSRLIARELGLSARELPRLLRKTDVDVTQLLKDESRLTATQQMQILRNALDLSGKPEFGLRLGRRLTPATHGVMGFVANSSPDLYTALQAVHTFLPTRASFIQVNLQNTEDYLECVVSFQVAMDNDVERCLADTVIKAFFEIGEFIVGRPLYESEVHFPHPAPVYQDMYREYLPGKVYFDCNHFKLKLAMELCRKPNASANHESYHLAFQQCESMLARLENPEPDYRTRLQKMMFSRPPGTLSEDEAAASLFMSKRTLARKLKKENSSFRKIRDEVLSRQAANYLCESQLSVEATATLLNYHDTASFRRAFKRWFGQTPDQYRQRTGT